MRKSNLVNRVSGLIAIALVVASCLPFSTSGLPANQQPHSLSNRLALPQSPLAFSDFDGDNKSDRAELFSNGQHKNIQISFGNSSLKSLSYDTGTTDPGKLFCRDLDGDNDDDLFWVSQSFPRKFLFWINDGQGNFTLDEDFQPDLPTQKALLGDGSDSSLRQGMDDQNLSCAIPSPDSRELATITLQLTAHPTPAPLSRTDEGHVVSPSQSVYYRRGPPADLS